MAENTIEIRPSDYLPAAEVRRALARRVRLKVREKSRWWLWTVFYVTGPQWALDEATQEIANMENEAWWARQW